MRNHTDPWMGWQDATLRLAIYLTATIVGAIVLIPLVAPVGLLIWVTLVFGGLVYLVHWHTESFDYRCQNPACSHAFQIPWWLNLISLHGVGNRTGRTFLRCPYCRRFGWQSTLTQVGESPR